MLRALPKPPGTHAIADVGAELPVGGNGAHAIALADASKRTGELAALEPLQVVDPADPVKPRTGGAGRASAGPHELRERARKENLRECCNICIFFVFLVVFTSTMLLEQTAPTSRLADHIRAKLDGGVVPLATVSTTSSLYDYLERGFVAAIYEDSIDTQMAKDTSASLIAIDLSNRLLGTVRLRQLRVAVTKDCQVNPMFETYAISCYPPFTAATQSTADFGSGEAFRYSSGGAGSTFSGNFASYGPQGFMQLLPANSSMARTALVNLRARSFLDAATRAVFIEFNVWSSNVATYAAVSIVVEFGPSNAVKPQVEVLTVNERSLVPGGLGFTSDWVAFFGVIVVMLFVVWYIVEELQEIWIHRVNYFFDLWNILDWLNMIVLIVAFGMRIVNFIEASDLNVGQQALHNTISFSSMRSIAFRAMTVRLFHAVNAVLLWGKAIKYFRHMPMVKDLIIAVWRAFDLFLPFLCMFGVAFIGFVMAYNIGFGDKILELSTFDKTAVYLCRAFVRDITLMPVYDLITPLFGLTLNFLFYVTLILIGASFLFAIIADALFRAKHMPDPKPNPFHEDEPVEEFMRELRKRFPCLFKCCSAKSQRGDADDGGDASNNATRSRKPADLQSTRDALVNLDATSKSGSQQGHRGPVLPTRANLMRAVELMSGRVLSEISIVSIEIRSAPHVVFAW